IFSVDSTSISASRICSTSWKRLVCSLPSMLVCASSSISTTSGFRFRMASTSISSNSVPLYSICLRGTCSSCAASSAVRTRPCVSTNPITTSSPRLFRRIASLSMLNVLPTPGAYPRNTLNRPRCCPLTSASHSSGVFVRGCSEFIRLSLAPGAWYLAPSQHLPPKPVKISFKHRKPLYNSLCVHQALRRDRSLARHRSRACRYCSPLPAFPRHQPHHRRAHPAAARPRPRRQLGPALRRRRLHRRHPLLQLLFPSPRRHPHHCRHPKLGRSLRLPRHRHLRQPSRLAHPRGVRGGQRPPPRIRDALPPRPPAPAAGERLPALQLHP